GLDPTQDTPIEILHTILLGVVKYFWHGLHTEWTDREKNNFTIRLQSTDTSGMKVPPIRATYIMQYRNNLIGKNFKTLMQTMVFHLHGITTPKQFTLVRAVGDLGALLWITEIDDMEQYLADLTIVIGNVLDAFADIDPTKIINKVKLHLLAHLPQDIWRFGPAVRSSTEVFECFNAIFCLCSILSNHQALSRDISTQFSLMDCVRHLISGGYWKTDDGWIQARPKVLEVLKTDTVKQRHLGWAPLLKVNHGAVTLKGLEKNPAREWLSTACAQGEIISTDINDGPPNSSLWRTGKSMVMEVGDTCSEGSWVFARKDPDSGFVIGRVKEILSPENISTDTLVCLEEFSLGRSWHPVFDMPILQCPAISRCVVVTAQSLYFRVSVQHDCRTLGCKAKAQRHQRQEREVTSQEELLIDHASDDHFVLNMHALHNAHLLRRVLERSLYAPRPLYENCQDHHAEISMPL
ncbi:hypothetical protein BKA70DRAFT_1133414, partial [Coprinopsis sp. MPI-PUGE-AT-0042]